MRFLVASALVGLPAGVSIANAEYSSVGIDILFMAMVVAGVVLAWADGFLDGRKA